MLGIFQTSSWVKRWSSILLELWVLKSEHGFTSLRLTRVYWLVTVVKTQRDSSLSGLAVMVAAALTHFLIWPISWEQILTPYLSHSLLSLVSHLVLQRLEIQLDLVFSEVFPSMLNCINIATDLISPGIAFALDIVWSRLLL